MGRKLLLTVVGVALLLGVSGCGTTSKEPEPSQRVEKTEAKDMVSVIRNGDTVLLEDATALQEMLEIVVSDECKKPLMLSLQLTEAEMESYKEEGTYIELVYEDGKEFSEITGSSETKIEKVYFLMREDSGASYISYSMGKSSKVFSLSQASRDAIIEFIK